MRCAHARSCICRRHRNNNASEHQVPSIMRGLVWQSHDCHVWNWMNFLEVKCDIRGRGASAWCQWPLREFPVLKRSGRTDTDGSQCVVPRGLLWWWWFRCTIVFLWSFIVCLCDSVLTFFRDSRNLTAWPVNLLFLRDQSQTNTSFC